MTGTSRGTVALVGAVVLAATSATAAVAAPHGSGRHQVSKAPAWVAHARAARTAAPAAAHAKIWLTPRDTAGLTGSPPPSRPRTRRRTGTSSVPRSTAPATHRQRRASRPCAPGRRTRACGSTRVGSDNHFVSVSGSGAAVSSAFTGGPGDLQRRGPHRYRADHGGHRPGQPRRAGPRGHRARHGDPLDHPEPPEATGARRRPTPPPPRATSARPRLRQRHPVLGVLREKVDTTDPAFEGKHLPYAVCGYVPTQLRSTYGVSATRRTGRGETVAITDAFAAPTIEKDANTYAARHGDRAFRRTADPVQRHQRRPARSTSAAATAGSARRPSTSRPCTGWPPTPASPTTARELLRRRPAGLAGPRVSDNKASAISNSWGEPTYVTVDGTVYPTVDQTLATPTSRSSSRVRCRASGSTTPPVTAATRSTTPVSSRPTGPRPTPGSPRSAAPRWRSTSTAGASSRPAGAPSVLADGRRVDLGRLPLRGRRRLQRHLRQAVLPVHASTGCFKRGVPDVAMDADPTTGMLVGETQVFDAHTSSAGHAVRRVPHRRDEPGRAAVRGAAGRRAAGPGPDRLRQPAGLPPRPGR